MPTEAEQDELRNTDNCTWEWTTQKGVNGYKVISVKNGNSIFLPAAGYRYGDRLYHDGEYGEYWSSTSDEGTDYAYGLFIHEGYSAVGWIIRSDGRSVRPVLED